VIGRPLTRLALVARIAPIPMSMRASGLVLMLCAAGCGRLGFDPGAAPGPHSALLLHLDRSDVQEPLIDFPLLVQLDDQHLDRSRLRDDARDLQFTLDGQPLAYEIEDPGAPGGPPVIAWVRLPKLFGRDTTIRVDHGGGEPTVESSMPVWSASYAAVFHLAEAAGSTRDATGHYPGSSVTEVGAPGPSPAPGWISGGRAFVSTSRNAIQVDARDLMYSPFTVSGWLYETMRPQGFHALVSREHESAGANAFWIGDQGGTYQGELFDTAEQFVKSNVAAKLGQWVHLALTATSSVATLYIDGVVVQTSGPLAGFPAPTRLNPIVLGADNNSATSMPNSDFLDGRLDEVRVETVARPAEWLRVDHLSMTDQLIRYEVVPE
jgi:hypothetical protein